MTYSPRFYALFLMALTCSSMTMTACQKSEKKPNAEQEKTTQNTVDENVEVKEPLEISDETPDQSGKWGYGKNGSIAPKDWGNDEINRLCAVGKEQSPINIKEVTTESESNFSLTHQYISQDFDISNNGHTIVFNAKNPTLSKSIINGKKFNLLQFHYHMPSEHWIKGERYPLEINFVHRNADDNQLVIVGALYKPSTTNEALSRVISALPQSEDDVSNTLTDFNARSILPEESGSYVYSGSLTTPPCSENVQWVLKDVPTPIGEEQLQKLKQLHNNNNRPLQQQGERTVYHFELADVEP